MDSPSKLSTRCSSGSTPSSTLPRSVSLRALAGLEVVHPDLMRLRRRRERERNARPVRREDEVLRDSVTRQREAVHPRVAVLVRDHQQVPARVVADAIEVPLRLVQDLPAAAERVARDRERVPALVRRADEAGRVGEPDRVHVLGLPVVRRHVDDLAGLDPEQEQVRVAAQLAELPGDDPAAVGRELAVGAPAAELERPLVSGSRAAARRRRSRGRCGGSSSTRAARRRARRAASGG